MADHSRTGTSKLEHCDVLQIADAFAINPELCPEHLYDNLLTDIESNPALFESYKERIPVVRINGEESFVYKAHEITLRKKLNKIMEL